MRTINSFASRSATQEMNGWFGKLLWGYDNASFYRITINPDGKTLQLNQSPVDAFHAPQAGQL